MKKLLSILAVLIASAALAVSVAQDKASEQKDVDYVAPLPPPDVDELRDPFWEPGRSPKPVEVIRTGDTDTPAVVIKWEEARKKIVVKSMGGSGARLGAMVEGIKGTSGSTFVLKGETVSVDHEGLNYRWKITDIVRNKGITTKQVGEPRPIRK